MDIIENKIESDEEEEQIPDEDICPESELKQLFSTKLHLASETSVSLKKAYILHLANSTNFDKIAAATSEHKVHLYDFLGGRLTETTTLDSNVLSTKNDDTICRILFENTNSNCLYIGIESGNILQYDLRSGKIVATFKDLSEKDVKPICTFDLNGNDRILCAGTERIRQDAFLLFFDTRKPQTVMGGYWESHDDDITQVRFHPTVPDTLASGSTDGLINVYDVSNTNEDDALQSSLNTESSVQTINWHKNVYEQDLLSCITHTNDLLIYDVTESDLIVSHSRDDLTKAIKRKSTADCNVINCHNSIDNDVWLLVGSNYNQGECLRSVKIQNRDLLPLTNFTGTKQIVRSSIYNNKDNVLITSGESAIISVWTPTEAPVANKSDSSQLKEKSKLKNKSHKIKPY